MVAEVVRDFNTFEEETSNGKCVWIVEKGQGVEEYWQILSKHERQNDVSCVALVYQEGDTVVLGEVADKVLPNFLNLLLFLMRYKQVLGAWENYLHLWSLM